MIKPLRKIAKLLIGVVIIMLVHSLMSASHAQPPQPQNNSLPPGAGFSLDTFSVDIVRITTTTLAFVLLVAFQFALKITSRVSSELDRIGSDINLYGFGISFALFILASDSKEPLFSWIEPKYATLFIAVAMMAACFSYLINLFLSERIRNLDFRFRDGVETLEQLNKLLEDPKGRRLVTASLAIACFPTFLLLLALALR